jgi:radical S-adenosyl methionine domain-containing protein 2
MIDNGLSNLYLNPCQIISVCWDITGNCNENCPFCFRDRSRKELDIDSALTVIEKLSNYGIKKLTFAGGEPLLVNHLDILLSQVKFYGIQTSLTTNGILLEKQWDKIIPNCDWITFSLDASNPELQAAMGRDKSHFDRIIYLIEKITQTTRINIKINTVATRKNINNILDLANIVKELPIKRWKIIRFYGIRGSAKENISTFDINDKDFNTLKEKIPAFLTEKNIIMDIIDHCTLENTYLSLYCDGTLRFSKNNNDYSSINLVTSDMNNLNIAEYFDYIQHTQNHYWL